MGAAGRRQQSSAGQLFLWVGDGRLLLLLIGTFADVKSLVGFTGNDNLFSTQHPAAAEG